MDTFLLKTQALQFTDEEFFNFCVQNKELRFERDKHQNIIVMSPAGYETGNYNSNIILQLGSWNQKTRLGYSFDSNTGFFKSRFR